MRPEIGMQATKVMTMQRGTNPPLRGMLPSLWWEGTGRLVLGLYLGVSGLAGMSWLWPHLVGVRGITPVESGPLLGGIVAILVLCSGILAGLGRMTIPFIAICFLQIVSIGSLLFLVGPGKAAGPRPDGLISIAWGQTLHVVMLVWLVTRWLDSRAKAQRLFRGISILLLVVFLARLPSDAKQWGEEVGRSLTVSPRAEKLFVGQRVLPLRVQDSRGTDLTLEEPGVLYVVNFWATWCPPCLEELPELLALSGRFEGTDELRIMAVNTEDLDSDKLSAFLEKQGLKDLPVYRDHQEWYESQGLGTIPMTLFLQNGRILSRYRGYGKGTMGRIETAIREHVSGKTPRPS